MTTKEKQCGKCGNKFVITESDSAFYEKIGVPEPKNCPKCRLIRRLLERNIRNLYYRKCDYSGEKIISPYHENQPFPVYKSEIWWSDKWDAMDYGMDFDPNRPFFEQFKELKNKVPHFATFIIDGTLQNSDFTNCTGYLKNCYLIGESDYDEDCYYSNLLKHSKNMVDCSTCYNSEICYECIDCMGCYNLKYSQDCEECKNSLFLKDCRSCMDCIGCVNQVHKQYMVKNKQYSKEEYEKIKESLGLNTYSGTESLKQEIENFFKTQFHRNLHEEYNENCSGEHLYQSKNAELCFDSKDLEDCKYCQKVSLYVKNSMDYTGWGMNVELAYQCAACGDQIYNMKFCSTCTTSLHDCEYVEQCSASSYLFGCFGLKHKKYCILNKQYTKEEFETLREKIIEHMKRAGEWGEFPPLDHCTFTYNETIAMDYYPLMKEEAVSQGYGWKDPDKKEFKPQKYTVADNISEVKDDIVDEILTCESRLSDGQACRKNFRVMTPELQFYKDQNIPIPRFCPDCRHQNRMRKRPAPELHKVKCVKCGIETTTSDKNDNNIYCKKCYLETVV